VRILVVGGTGTVGSQVVRELIARGASVRVLTRDPSKAKLPAGVTAVQGDLTQPDTVRRVFKDVDAAFLLNGISMSEGHEGLLAVSGMKLSGLKRLVYLSVHQVDKAAWLPHFGVKVGVEEGIKRSGIPFTILRPDNFFQNDYWYKDVILNYGIYPQPIGDVGTSRVDVRDIAEAAAIALTSTGHEGQTYDIVGPDVLTGDAIARTWSRVLGKPIAYGGNDLDAWEAQSLQYLPAWMVFDFRMMYEHFQKNGLKASPAAVARLTTLLGHAPRSFEAFVTETATAWK